MRAVEFFSGIGGWSFALKHSCESVEVVAAYDINPIANKVYQLNHNIKPHHKSIEKLSAKELQSFNADVWLMSPPCQPHTRNNTSEKRDVLDPRSNAFLHLLEMLLALSNPPTYLALEVCILLALIYDSVECDCRTL